MRKIMIAIIHQMMALILIGVKEMIMIHMIEKAVIITVIMYININLILARKIK
jgi:hypothetical protein